ncbi:hypothetical protein GCM10009555_063530 [Acrocarpospora macrocephala]|uniref:CHAT domain-containing protein n=1 Tax=Acrocarpospora macrocephala TaxID=150177 RepID=A0A5M3WHV4_9ACTN|nr:CHAT domain-containing protein [Acrocarpospora macrocephala]GES07712.1 hypothetical protein Amac_013070 [Acrocarpospora macrocephala]
MVPADVLVWAAREDLSGQPGKIFAAADRAGDVTVCVFACLAAGEPGRAAQLAPRAPEGLRSLMGVLITRLARAWFPGNLSGDDLTAVRYLGRKHLDTLGLDRSDWLVMCPMAEVGMLRSTVMGAARVGVSQGRAAAHRYGDYVNDFMVLARDHGLDRYVDLLSCLQAELLGLGGLPEDSVRLAEAVLERSRRAADHSMAARARLLIGDAYATPGSSPEILGLDLGDLNRSPSPPPSARTRELALAAYRDAEEDFHRADAPRGRAAVLVRRAFLERSAGRPGSARELLDGAERLYAAAGDVAGAYLTGTHRVLAEIDDGLFTAAGAELAGDLGGWAAAAGSPSLTLGLSRLIRAVGRMWRHGGEVERARACLSLAADIAVAVGDAAEERSALGDLSDLYASLNSRKPTVVLLERALDRRLRGLGGWDALPGVDFALWSEIAELTVFQTAQFMDLRDADGLRQSGQRMRRLVEHRPEGRDTPPPVRNPVIHGDLAMRELERFGLGRVTAAGEPVPHQDFAVPLVASLAGSLISQVHLTRCMAPLIEAKRLRRSGSPAEADRLVEEVLALARDIGTEGRPYAVVALSWAGRLAEARDEVRALAAEAPDMPPARHAELLVAAHAYQEARTLLRERGQDPSFAGTLPRRRHVLAARIALGCGDVTGPAASGVLAELERDIDEFERRFAALRRDAYRTSVCDDAEMGETYFLAARLARAAGAAGSGHEYGGRLRALPLHDTLADSAAIRDAPPAHAAVLLRWQQANVAWTAAFEQVAALRPASPQEHLDGVREAQERLDAAQAALEQAERAALDAMPGILLRTRRVASVSPAKPPPLELPGGTLLLDYLVGADRTLVWARSRDRVHAWELEVDGDELAGMASRTTRSFAGRSLPEDGEGAADELAALLLGPVRTMLEDHERVLVAPSGALALVPFGALDLRPATPLIAEHTISYLPGAELLDRLSFPWRPAAEGAALVVGDPRFHPERGLSRLRGAGVEAYHVGGLLGVTPLQGGAARKTAVRDRAMGARILHFATHGLISPQAPTASAIALAGADELTMADLAGLALRADLVVLSACDTGQGEPTFGGELVGFTRALIAAGARRALVSLWPVHDRITCVIMERFYRRLAEGDTPAEALSRAQRWTKDQPSTDLAIRYRRLAAAAGKASAGGSLTRTRDGSAPAGSGPAEGTGFWAPFILVGSP